jgi:hypothetical protein
MKSSNGTKPTKDRELTFPSCELQNGVESDRFFAVKMVDDSIIDRGIKAGGIILAVRHGELVPGRLNVVKSVKSDGIFVVNVDTHVDSEGRILYRLWTPDLERERVVPDGHFPFEILGYVVDLHPSLVPELENDAT